MIWYTQDENTQGDTIQRERVYGTKPPSAKTWSAQNHPDSFYFTLSNIFQILFILMFVKLQIQKKIHDFIKDGKLEKFKFEPMDKGWRAIV